MINLPNGFKVTVPEPIDSKLIMTKAEMLATKIGSMPSNYICLCKDDGKLYIWNANNEKDAELGRFRPYEKVIDLPDAIKNAFEDTSKKEELLNSISQTLPGAISTVMQGEKSTEFVQEMSQIFNDEQFDVVDKKIEIAVSLIQAIENN